MKGGRTTTVTAAAASTQLIDFQPDRKSLVFVNLGAADIWLSFGEAAGVNRGVKLAANGPPLVFSRPLHGGLLDGPWFGISAAGQPVGVAEGFGH